MSKYIGLLRGINVGGQNRLSMDRLRELCEGIGLVAVQTYLQSGNVVFQLGEATPALLAKGIEESIQKAFGYTVSVFIRQPENLQRILVNNPFLVSRSEDPTKLYVTFLYQEPSEAAWSKAIAPKGIADELARAEQAVYLICPNGYGKTKLSNGFFERKLGVPATTRNWNTVSMLYEIAKG